SEPISLIRDSGNRDVGFAFNDKESITADPTNANYAYAVWDRFTTPAGNSMANIEGAIHARSFREPIWFSRTTNGGQTWEPARNIYDRSEFNGTIGSQIVVLPNGDLINIFDEFFVHKNSDKQRGESISIIRSTDKGATWSKTSTVVAASLERGAFDPDTGRPIRAEGGIPEIAVDRSSGRLYAVWQDTRFSGVDEIALSTSSDGGRSWSARLLPRRVPGIGERGEQLRLRVHPGQQWERCQPDRHVRDDSNAVDRSGPSGICFRRGLAAGTISSSAASELRRLNPYFLDILSRRCFKRGSISARH